MFGGSECRYVFFLPPLAILLAILPPSLIYLTSFFSSLSQAGVDKLVYHTFNQEGSTGFQKGKAELDEFTGKGGLTTVKQILEACANSEKFQWGVSDGN
jgi:hypothetical protein